jgi:predicted RNase H-like HicB family nuclease
VIYRVELEQEEDGRWIADVVDLPGVMVYGATRAEAIARAEALALRVIADRIEHGEFVGGGPAPVVYFRDGCRPTLRRRRGSLGGWHRTSTRAKR